MDGDLRERAQTAWQAAQDEIKRVRDLPPVAPSDGGGGVLLMTDQHEQLRDLDEPMADLTRTCDRLQGLVAAAEGASATELPAAEWNLSAHIGSVEAKTRELRTQRERYQARWGNRS